MDHRKNILPNTYVPVLNSTTLVTILSRLPREVLVKLVNKWPKIINTQPPVLTDISQRVWNTSVLKETEKLKIKKSPKRIIIDKIMEFWPNGLNLLQLSQVDCQLIVDKPNAYSWISSIVLDSKQRETPIHLDPKKFLDMLAKDLNFMFMSHIYVCKHPRLPLIIIRIQVFDLQHSTNSKSTRPHIVSNRAFFVAIPIGSPYIIHSPGKDLVSDIVMQVIERNLPQRPNNLLRIQTDINQKPVKSLDAMYYLHNTRYANSLGAWLPYAESTIDISPLGTSDNHSSLQQDDTPKRPRDIANLRFKGKKQKTDDFASLAPIQTVEVLINEKYDNDEYSNVTLKLAGADVFGGLHELSVNSEVLDPKLVPSWLTGEEGRSCGRVRDGFFT